MHSIPRHELTVHVDLQANSTHTFKLYVCTASRSLPARVRLHRLQWSFSAAVSTVKTVKTLTAVRSTCSLGRFVSTGGTPLASAQRTSSMHEGERAGVCVCVCPLGVPWTRRWWLAAFYPFALLACVTLRLLRSCYPTTFARLHVLAGKTRECGTGMTMVLRCTLIHNVAPLFTGR